MTDERNRRHRINDWSSYDPERHRGPLSWIGTIFAGFLVISLGIGAVSWVVSYFTTGAAVIHRETNPDAAYQKYKWFKQASAQLDAKKKNIENQEARLAKLYGAYQDSTGKTLPHNQWTREDREEANLINAELQGLKGSFNNLAAEYNSAMADVLTAYANEGGQPDGAINQLPKEYKPYQ